MIHLTTDDDWQQNTDAPIEKRVEENSAEILKLYLDKISLGAKNEGLLESEIEKLTFEHLELKERITQLHSVNQAKSVALAENVAVQVQAATQFVQSLKDEITVFIKEETADLKQRDEWHASFILWCQRTGNYQSGIINIDATWDFIKKNWLKTHLDNIRINCFISIGDYINPSLGRIAHCFKSVIRLNPPPVYKEETYLCTRLETTTLIDNKVEVNPPESIIEEYIHKQMKVAQVAKEEISQLKKSNSSLQAEAEHLKNEYSQKIRAYKLLIFDKSFKPAIEELKLKAEEISAIYVPKCLEDKANLKAQRGIQMKEKVINLICQLEFLIINLKKTEENI